MSDFTIYSEGHPVPRGGDVTTDRTPTTAAGRALLARLSLDVPWFIAGSVAAETDLILAIEAEARAPLDVERLARAIHDLRWCKAGDLWHAIAHDDEEGYRTELARAYALAALEEPTDD
jgi:hypothetical protein